MSSCEEDGPNRDEANSRRELENLWWRGEMVAEAQTNNGFLPDHNLAFNIDQNRSLRNIKADKESTERGVPDPIGGFGTGWKMRDIVTQRVQPETRNCAVEVPQTCSRVAYHEPCWFLRTFSSYTLAALPPVVRSMEEAQTRC